MGNSEILPVTTGEDNGPAGDFSPTVSLLKNPLRCIVYMAFACKSYIFIVLTLLHLSFIEEFHDRPMPNIFLQFAVFLKREGILQFRYIRSLMLDMFLVLLAGGVLGALYAEVSYLF